MKMKFRHTKGRSWLAVALAGALLMPAPAGAIWGPIAGAWDPQEAYLHEYGYLDPYGPTLSDIRRMNRDNWKAFTGHPVYVDNVGPHGPTYSDVMRQQRRKARRLWGYY